MTVIQADGPHRVHSELCPHVLPAQQAGVKHSMAAFRGGSQRRDPGWKGWGRGRWQRRRQAGFLFSDENMNVS